MARKVMTTSIELDLQKEIKKLAIDLERPFNDLLEEAVRLIVEIVNVQFVNVHEYDTDSNEAEVRAHFGWKTKSKKSPRLAPRRFFTNDVCVTVNTRGVTRTPEEAKKVEETTTDLEPEGTNNKPVDEVVEETKVEDEEVKN